MNKVIIKNIFAAVSDKSILDPLLEVFEAGQKDRPFSSRTSGLRSGLSDVKFWGTQGTVKYLTQKGFRATSVVAGFDFDGRVKSLDKKVFAAILADPSKEPHGRELRRLGVNPLNAVIVDLYPLDAKNFPESIDVGGQALIRAAVKNYKNVAVAFDKKSIGDLIKELKKNKHSTTLNFRKSQAQKAAKFIAKRLKQESASF